MKPYFFSLFLLIIYFLPGVMKGGNFYVYAHDNLDLLVTYSNFLTLQDFFSHSLSIDQVMNGLPAGCFPAGRFNVLTWLYLFFNPAWAYIINDTLVHLLAFWGMYRLLKDHLALEDSVSLWAAFCFSLLPFYSVYGLSVAGQPLLLNAFLNIRRRKYTWLDFLIIIIFPLYSILALIGVFIIFVLGIWIVVDMVRFRKVDFLSCLAVGTLAGVYGAANYEFIQLMLFNKDFISHRVEFNRDTLTFLGCVNKMMTNFVYGQYHAVSVHNFILWLAVPCAILIGGIYKLNLRLLLALLFLAFLFSFIFGFERLYPIAHMRDQMGFLKSLQINRFHWFHPVLWYCIFALALSIIFRLKNGRYIAYGLIALQIGFLLVLHTEVPKSIKGVNLLRSVTKNNYDHQRFSYKQFFSEDLFNTIKIFIGRPQKDYRVASIGIQPAIALHNGFYTLDAYVTNYSLRYKNQFRNIMASELAKDPKSEDYFNNWASRCFISPVELDGQAYLTKDHVRHVQNLAINSKAFKEMGGKYIFSAVKIINAPQIGLKLLNIFEEENSPWRIFLYEAA